ncbi:hypothetical protein Xsto_01113 [Xenorhabdus stockiae]|uniref:DUF2834 domain-containing protein n=1 Tax=Xenorhabdus stockiae TaxID=351614 RepID=A0A2D0KSV0_9GAMM|nr:MULTISPECIES: DUF2834 domain-containing protein [Xenorhabdus]PHM66502.1 hypothetical protein Xsto_01113 [Xenorhabdus stockiae]PHM71704.1 hypothetical protein Xekj_00938 [Xenorhabdus sp. KJ12.1]
MTRFYLVLAILGAVIPWYFVFLFLAENGLNISLFIQLLLGNDATCFFVADVVISAIVLIFFVVYESRRLKMSNGIYSLLGLCIGVSFALPLFLYMRARYMEKAVNFAEKEENYRNE